METEIDGDVQLSRLRDCKECAQDRQSQLTYLDCVGPFKIISQDSIPLGSLRSPSQSHRPLSFSW